LNFDDVRYPRELFRAKKAAGELPFGQVPMLEASGNFVPQTNAMLRCVARLAKSTAYPVDDVLACAKVDAVLDQDADTFTGVLVVNYKERFGFDFLNDDESSCQAVRKTLRERVLVSHVTNLERQVGAGGWLGSDGNVPTIADFNWAPRLVYLRDHAIPEDDGKILDNCPKLSALIEKFYALTAVKAYYELNPAV